MPCMSTPFILATSASQNTPEVSGLRCLHWALSEWSYLLLDLLELPALLSDVMEKLQRFVILLGHLHPRLFQTSL